MLARYVRWHMERDLAPLLLTDHDPEGANELSTSIVAPAQRSAAGQRKVHHQRTDNGEPARSFDTLFKDLPTLTKNRIQVEGTEGWFHKYSQPTPLQEKVFQMLKVSYRM